MENKEFINLIGGFFKEYTKLKDGTLENMTEKQQRIFNILLDWYKNTKDNKEIYKIDLTEDEMKYTAIPWLNPDFNSTDKETIWLYIANLPHISTQSTKTITNFVKFILNISAHFQLNTFKSFILKCNFKCANLIQIDEKQHERYLSFFVKSCNNEQLTYLQSRFSYLNLDNENTTITNENIINVIMRTRNIKLIDRITTDKNKVWTDLKERLEICQNSIRDLNTMLLIIKKTDTLSENEFYEYLIKNHHRINYRYHDETTHEIIIEFVIKNTGIEYITDIIYNIREILSDETIKLLYNTAVNTDKKYVVINNILSFNFNYKKDIFNWLVSEIPDDIILHHYIIKILKHAKLLSDENKAKIKKIIIKMQWKFDTSYNVHLKLLEDIENMREIVDIAKIPKSSIQHLLDISLNTLEKTYHHLPENLYEIIEYLSSLL
jgi:hypothetical protein